MTVGFAMSGSFCTFSAVLEALEEVCERFRDVVPIMSETASGTDTRFGEAEAFMARVREISGREIITTIKGAEPIGPKALLDVLVIAPCTGNTIAKLSCGITDTAVTMAAKAHLRNGRPVVLAVSTNDGLSGNAGNIGALMNRKNMYFVPFGQDDPAKKPCSLMADFSLIPDAIDAAIKGRQLQPVLIAPRRC